MILDIHSAGNIGEATPASVERVFLPGTGAAGIARSVGGAPPASMSFGDMVSRGIQRVNEQLIDSQVALQKLAVGETGNLHHVMIGLEESRVSFQLMMQVRNRLLESYQDLMRMQV